MEWNLKKWKHNTFPQIFSLDIWSKFIFTTKSPWRQQRPDVTLSSLFSLSWQEEVARLAALQPQVDLLEKRLNELREEKEGEEDPSAFLDADISAFKEHYHKVLEDLRARERQLQLGERGDADSLQKPNPSNYFSAERKARPLHCSSWPSLSFRCPQFN